MSRPVALVDRAAFRANLAALRDRFAPAQTWLATKSDCYGHGRQTLLPVALAAGVDGLAVLDVETGLEMRAEGVEAPMLAWMHPHDADFPRALEAGIELGVNAAWQLEAIAAAAAARGGAPAEVHLKLDTGLHRGGVDAAVWDALVTRAVELERAGAVRIAACWTHLSDTSHEVDAASIAEFEAGVARARELGARPRILHAAASSAGIDFPEARYDLVRLGIAAYGVSPFHERTAADLGLSPVLTLEARVDRAADGCAVLGAGFGDGLPALPPGGADRPHVVLGGRVCEVLAIGIDETEIALPDGAPEPAVGEPAVVFGQGGPSAEQWADWCGTVADEMLTGLAPRVPRIARS